MNSLNIDLNPLYQRFHLSLFVFNSLLLFISNIPVFAALLFFVFLCLVHLFSLNVICLLLRLEVNSVQALRGFIPLLHSTQCNLWLNK